MRIFFTLKISWKSSPGWLQLVFHFGTENREEQLKKTPCISWKLRRSLFLTLHISRSSSSWDGEQRGRGWRNWPGHRGAGQEHKEEKESARRWLLLFFILKFFSNQKPPKETIFAKPFVLCPGFLLRNVSAHWVKVRLICRTPVDRGTWRGGGSKQPRR